MDSKEYYVDRHDTVKINFGLEKIYKLLEVLGNPQDSLKVIHIAGTNGKGSVSNYLAHILAYSGMKIGKISSPVIFNKMEFAQIYEFFDKVHITEAKEEIFNNLVNTFKNDIDCIKPSGYEIQIAFSIKYMLEQKCDIVIVECGMGGALDATNVFKQTLCDVLTSISIDHIGMIGESLEEIAKCKCGIITKDAEVVTTSTNKKVMDIIKCVCKEKKAQLKIANKEDILDVVLSINNNSFKLKSTCISNKDKFVKFTIRLNGLHQIENALIAIKVVEVLISKGYNISLEDIKMGLELTSQQARFDKISDNPIIIADGAHNVDGARCLVESIDTYFDKDMFIVYIISIFKDKDYKGIVKELLKNADEIWTFKTDNPRIIDSNELLNKAIDKQEHGIKVRSLGHIDDMFRYIEKNLKSQTVYVFAGSLSFMKDLYGRFRMEN